MRFSHGHAKTHAGLSGGLASAWQARKPQTWGLVSGGREGSGQGLGRCAACPASGSPSRLLPFSWPADVGRGWAHAGRIVCKGWAAGDGRRVFSRSPSFQVVCFRVTRLVFPLPAYPKIYQVKSFQVAEIFRRVPPVCFCLYFVQEGERKNGGIYGLYIKGVKN